MKLEDDAVTYMTRGKTVALHTQVCWQTIPGGTANSDSLVPLILLIKLPLIPLNVV